LTNFLNHAFIIDIMKAKSPYLEELRGSMKQGNDGITARMNIKGEIVIEKIPTHYDANTDLQEEQRQAFKSAIEQWDALSDQEKEEWREKASPYGLTGYQYFISQNIPHEVLYKVTIDNTGGASLSDYQILISINNDTGFFADCDSKKAAIRIYDSDKTTPLSYWIEEWDTANSNAKIWVKVPSIPAGGMTYLYISIDPSRTEDASSGEETFLFFDDFEGTDLDTDKWDIAKKGSTNAIVELDGNGNLHLAGEQDVTSSGNVKSKTTFTNGFIIELRHKIDEEHYADVSIGSGQIQDPSGGQSNWYHTFISDGYGFFWQTPISGSVQRDIIIEKIPANEAKIDLIWKDAGDLTTLNEWHTLKYVYDSSGNLKWYHDGTLWLETTDTDYLSNAKYLLLSQGEYSAGAGGNRYIDWVRVRKYADPEPGISYERE